jgi:hypothetical protein
LLAALALVDSLAALAGALGIDTDLGETAVLEHKLAMLRASSAEHRVDAKH